MGALPPSRHVDVLGTPDDETIEIANLVERERDALVRQARLTSIHWLVVALSLIVTLSAWQYSKSLVALRTEARFALSAEQIPELIRERLQKYELALLAGASALKANGGTMDWGGWHDFASNLDIERLYPGINGIGLISDVAADEIDAFLARQRETRPDFTIYPSHGKDRFQPITHIYPIAPNAQAIGLDMVHETNRHSSLNKARDTGLPQITGPIVLVQDAENTPGFLFFMPFYGGADPQTEDMRQAAFTGAVYAPFIVHKLMSGTLGESQRSAMVRISDEDQVIYDEISEDNPDFDPKTLAEKRISMELYGRDWNLDIRAGLGFRAQNSPHESTYILVAGLVLDMLLLALMLLLARANSRGLRFADLATMALRRDADVMQANNAALADARKKAEGVGEMKSVFLSTMSHEIRTPLTAISGILMLLSRAKLSSEQSELVQVGQTASKRLLKLLTDVLDVSKLEANAVKLWEREVDLRVLISEWGLLAEGMVESLGKDIKVTTSVADTLPDTVLVDDIRLAQVVNNLLDNAVRFTHAGQISLDAQFQPSLGTGCGSYALTISDTGKGMLPEHLPGIFDRFRQVDASITRAEGGSGLGLAICKDLVRLLGGEIEVSSEVGIGTTFVVTLPVGAPKP